MYSLVVERFRNFVTQSSRFHPADGKQIAKRFKQTVPNAVMALPRAARIVRDRHFGNGERFELDQRRQKSMRPVEKLHVRDAFTLEDAISAARVGNVL